MFDRLLILLFAVRGSARRIALRASYPFSSGIVAYRLAGGEPLRDRLGAFRSEFGYIVALMWAERGLTYRSHRYGGEFELRGWVIRCVAFNYFEAVQPPLCDNHYTGTLPEVRRMIERDQPRLIRLDRWIAANWFDATGWRRNVATAVDTLPWI